MDWLYAKFLAAEWRENQEFAKSKGWIKSYMIFSNAYPRPGEPDMYLVTITEDIPSGATSEKRQDEYMAWKKKSLVQMQQESGNRAEFREVISQFAAAGTVVPQVAGEAWSRRAQAASAHGRRQEIPRPSAGVSFSKRDLVDVGARPEEILAARAMWNKATAGAELADKTYRRLNALYAEGLISRQRNDEAQANYTAALETARAAGPSTTRRSSARARRRSGRPARPHGRLRAASRKSMQRRSSWC